MRMEKTFSTQVDVDDTPHKKDRVYSTVQWCA